MRLRLLCLMCLLSPGLLLAQEPVDGPVAGPLPASRAVSAAMTNDSVLRMVKAGLSDDLIVDTIQNQPGQFTTDSDSMVALKQAGVSDRVITAMVNKSRVKIAGPADPIVLSDVNEIGVYYKDKTGKWEPIDPEIIHIKSGGWLKSEATRGIIKEDQNGHLDGRESKLALQRPVDILVYAPVGVDISEYDLLCFRLNGDGREFRTLTGGVIHSTQGAQRDEVKFTAKKTAPRTFEFRLNTETPGGEYGLLPPGTGNITNGGKIYTFAIVE